ncbi:hypothetical protein BC831DRAFT_480282 [Entophlyctis helioformis]|nr:hypothetical protein BC831DRAFT_480282 [Entophlyctis helioformis]
MNASTSSASNGSSKASATTATAATTSTATVENDDSWMSTSSTSTSNTSNSNSNSSTAGSSLATADAVQVQPPFQLRATRSSGMLRHEPPAHTAPQPYARQEPTSALSALLASTSSSHASAALASIQGSASTPSSSARPAFEPSTMSGAAAEPHSHIGSDNDLLGRSAPTPATGTRDTASFPSAAASTSNIGSSSITSASSADGMHNHGPAAQQLSLSSLSVPLRRESLLPRQQRLSVIGNYTGYSGNYSLPVSHLSSILSSASGSSSPLSFVAPTSWAASMPNPSTVLASTSTTAYLHPISSATNEQPLTAPVMAVDTRSAMPANELDAASTAAASSSSEAGVASASTLTSLFSPATVYSPEHPHSHVSAGQASKVIAVDQAPLPTSAQIINNETDANVQPTLRPGQTEKGQTPAGNVQFTPPMQLPRVYDKQEPQSPHDRPMQDHPPPTQPQVAAESEKPQLVPAATRLARLNLGVISVTGASDGLHSTPLGSMANPPQSPSTSIATPFTQHQHLQRVNPIKWALTLAGRMAEEAVRADGNQLYKLALERYAAVIRHLTDVLVSISQAERQKRLLFVRPHRRCVDQASSGGQPDRQSATSRGASARDMHPAGDMTGSAPATAMPDGPKTSMGSNDAFASVTGDEKHLIMRLRDQYMTRVTTILSHLPLEVSAMYSHTFPSSQASVSQAPLSTGVTAPPGASLTGSFKSGEQDSVLLQSALSRSSLAKSASSLSLASLETRSAAGQTTIAYAGLPPQPLPLVPSTSATSLQTSAPIGKPLSRRPAPFELSFLAIIGRDLSREPLPGPFSFDPLVRPLQVMQRLAKSMVHGEFLTPQLYIPCEVWTQPGGKITSAELKLAAIQQLFAPLGRLRAYQHQDPDIQHLAHFQQAVADYEAVMDTVRVALLKKLKYLTVDEDTKLGGAGSDILGDGTANGVVAVPFPGSIPYNSNASGGYSSFGGAASGATMQGPGYLGGPDATLASTASVPSSYQPATNTPPSAGRDRLFSSWGLKFQKSIERFKGPSRDKRSQGGSGHGDASSASTGVGMGFSLGSSISASNAGGAGPGSLGRDNMASTPGIGRDGSSKSLISGTSGGTSGSGSGSGNGSSSGFGGALGGNVSATGKTALLIGYRDMMVRFLTESHLVLAFWIEKVTPKSGGSDDNLLQMMGGSDGDASFSAPPPRSAMSTVDAPEARHIRNKLRRIMAFYDSVVCVVLMRDLQELLDRFTRKIRNVSNM